MGAFLWTGGAPVKVFFFLIAAAGTVFSSPHFPSDDSHYHSLLEKRDLIVASKWQYYFEAIEASQPENEAQYYLFLGQPRRAFLAIEKIRNPQRKNLFQAVLYALVSVSREAVSKEESDDKVIPSSGKTQVYPIDEGEIWPDEWEEIEIVGSEGREMPVVADEETRLEFREESKRLFETLETQDFLSDFNVVSLAMDVGAKLPHPEKILVHHALEEGNPYYTRLLEETGRVNPSVLKAKSFSRKNLELRLSDLKLSLNETVSHPLQTPFLLPEREGR